MTTDPTRHAAALTPVTPDRARTSRIRTAAGLGVAGVLVAGWLAGSTAVWAVITMVVMAGGVWLIVSMLGSWGARSSVVRDQLSPIPRSRAPQRADRDLTPPMYTAGVRPRAPTDTPGRATLP